jgi:hypothetical protein
MRAADVKGLALRITYSLRRASVRGEEKRFCKIKNPRSKLRGIEDFSLKSPLYVGEQIPHTPSSNRPKGRGIKPH